MGKDFIFLLTKRLAKQVLSNVENDTSLSPPRFL